MCILNASRNGTPHIKDILVFFLWKRLKSINGYHLSFHRSQSVIISKVFWAQVFFPNRQLALGVKIKIHLKI